MSVTQETSPLHVISPAREPEHMWHITLTVSGEVQDLGSVRSALQRFSERHPFLMDARYSGDRAEIRYWEEATNLATAVDLASRVWRMNADAAGLPGWHVVGVEVVDRATMRHRGERDAGLRLAGGRITPL